MSAKPGRKAKTLIIEDERLFSLSEDRSNLLVRDLSGCLDSATQTYCDSVPLDEANPFSFKEFVKSKTRPLQCDGELHKDIRQHSTLTLEAADLLALNSEYQETFFKDPTVAEDLLDDEEEEDEDWSGSYHPSVIEQTHNADTSQGSLYDESYRYSDISGCDPFSSWLPAGGTSPSTKPQTPNGAVNDSAEDLRFQALQLSYQALQQENTHLKRQVQTLSEQNESQAERVRDLQRQLEEKILEEQKEAQDLESMVQQVEANLQMMTKRASKAESHVTKLKQEVALLQIHLNTYKTENEALRRGESAGMTAVKQNANLALENLHKAVSGAQTSIKQLVSGAEALNLVADLLKSIDKIAEVHEDVP